MRVRRLRSGKERKNDVCDGIIDVESVPIPGMRECNYIILLSSRHAKADRTGRGVRVGAVGRDDGGRADPRPHYQWRTMYFINDSGGRAVSLRYSRRAVWILASIEGLLGSVSAQATNRPRS